MTAPPLRFQYNQLLCGAASNDLLQKKKPRLKMVRNSDYTVTLVCAAPSSGKKQNNHT